jgi:hypothetical protein
VSSVGDVKGAWTAEEMTAAMDQLQALSMATWRELLVHVAAYDKAEAWRADGMCSMADWLVARYGLARRTANLWVRAALALEELPEVANAVAGGRLSADQVRSVIGLATPETDAAVAADAVGRSAAELETMVRLAKPPRPDEGDDADRLRTFRWRDIADGRAVRLSGQLPAAEAATVTAALTRLAEQAGPDATTGVFDPFGSRCADALVDLAGAVLADDADPDRATVVVHVPTSWFADADDTRLGNAVAAALESGVPLAADTLRRLACDARVQLVAEGPGHAAMARTAMEHTVPFWLRRQLRRRDGGCRWPGCRRTRGLHAHHIVWFSKGGPTVIENLVLLCRRHHRAVHEGGWGIEGDPAAELRFQRPDGRGRLATRPPPLRDDVRQRLKEWVPSLGTVPRLAFDAG